MGKVGNWLNKCGDHITICITVTINGVRDGDDQSVYVFETEDMNGVTNQDEYQFIVLRQPVQLDLESINPFAVEGNETPISKCIARGKWLDFFFLSILFNGEN